MTRLRYPWPHCAAGGPCTTGADGDGACACPCRGCRAARWGVSGSGVYRPRWQWWAPWAVTRRWRAERGADEWCNPSVWVIFPPLGGLCLFWRPGPMRTMPCAEEWRDMSEAERAGYAPCGRYHGGRVNWAGHSHQDGACEEARKWLETAAAE